MVLCFVFAVRAIQNGDKNIKFEEEGSGSETDSINNIIKKINEGKKKIIDDTEPGSGTDDEETDSSGSGESGVGEGEGSGDVKDTYVTPTTKVKSGTDNTTPVVINITLVTKKTTAEEETTTKKFVVIQADPNPGKSSSEKEGTGINFTLGIIIGVVVGALLAILIIVFLVYRLRKKDEGSYSLDEQSSTAYLRTDTDNPTKGKEYFA